MSGPAIVELSDYAGTAPKVLYHEPYEVNGTIGQGWTTKMCVVLPMDEIFTFSTFCGGTLRNVDLGGSVFADRIIPLSDPLNPALLCRSIRAKGTGHYTLANAPYLDNWSHVKFELEFGSVPFPVDGSTPFMIVSAETKAEIITVAGAKLTFGDGSPIQADAGITMPVKNYTVKMYQCPTTDDATCDPLTGLVNTSTVTIGGVARSAGTVRFDGQATETTVTTGLATTYTRELKLAWRPIEWNKFLRHDGVWDYAQKPDTTYIYADGDLTALFT